MTDHERKLIEGAAAGGGVGMGARADIESLGVIGEDGQPMGFVFNGQRHAVTAIASLAINTRDGVVTHAGWTVAELRTLAAILPERSRVQLPVHFGDPGGHCARRLEH